MSGAKAGTAYVAVDADLDRLQRQIRKAVGPMSKDVGRGMGRSIERESGRATKSIRSWRSESEGLTNSVLRLKLAVGALSLGPAASGLNALAAGGVAATGSLEPLVGTLAVIPSLASAAGQALGTVTLGSAGIGDAIKAANDQVVSSSGDATDALDRQHAAAESARTADLALADAKRQSKIAQEGLTSALADGERQIEDLRRAARRAAGDENEAVRELRRARADLSKAETDPEGTRREREDARQRVTDARQDLEDLRVQIGREKEDLQKARKVEDLPQVVDARRGIADADRAVAEAKHQVREASRDQTKALGKESAAVDRYQEALKDLSPEQQHFVKTLVGYRPVLKDLQAASARGLLPGAEKGLAAASRNADVLERVLEGTGDTLGDVAENIGRYLGTRGVGRDLEIQGARNQVTIRRTGEAGIYLADALRHVTLEAGPLVGWITKSAVAWAKATDEEVKAKRASGELRDDFEDTRFILERLVSITGHLGDGLHSVFEAGKTDGDQLWISVDRLAGRFDDWAASREGQESLKQWFGDGRDALEDLGEEIEQRIDQFRDLRNEGRSSFDALAIVLSDTLTEALSQSVENMAKRAPVLAEAFIHGFFEANAWGRLALGGFLLAKLGGLGAFKAIGSKSGGAYGAAFAAGAAPEIAAVTAASNVSPFFSPIHGPQAPTGAPASGRWSGRGRQQARFPGDLAGAFVHRDLGPQAPTARRPFGMRGWAKDAVQNPVSDLVKSGTPGKLGATFGKNMAATAGPRMVAGLGASLAGGIPGLAVGAAVLFGPEFVKAIDDKAHPIAKNGLPKTGDALSKGLRTSIQRIELEDLVGGDPGQILSKVGGKIFGDFLGGDLTDAEKRLRSFGDTASATFKRLNAKQDVDGIRQMANQARRLAKEFPDASKELNAFARAADRSAGNVQTTVEAQRKAGRMSDQFAKNLRGLRLSGTKDFDGLVNSVVDGSRNILRVGGKNSEKTRQEVSKQFGIAERRIKTAMDRGVISVKEGTGRLNELAKKQLGLYGIKAGRVSVVLAQGAEGQGMRPHQRGGHINEGRPSGDSVPALLERDEYVLNRKAVAAVGRDKLDAINFGMAPRFQVGGQVGRFQQGGIVPVPGFPGERANRAILDEIAWVTKHFPGLVLTDAFGSGHESPGHTVTGTAADFSGPDAAMDAAVKALVGKGFLVGYDGRFGSQSWPGHGPSYVTDNFHLHAEFGSGSGTIKGGAGLQAEDLPRIQLKGPPSVALEAGQGALDRIRSAAQASLDQAASASLGLPVAGGGGGVISGDGDVEKVFAEVTRRLSTSKVATLALGMAGYDESGMQDLSYGDASSQGALQLLSSTAAGLGVSPHDEGAIASLFYQHGFYGKGGANALAAQGLPAHLVAQGVQGSATADGSNYLRQEGAARAWMKRFGLVRGGLVGYIGDSLGVGTVGQGGLGSKLKGRKLRSNVEEGRFSPEGVQILRGWDLDPLGALVFDLGTNDDPAGILGGSLGSVKNIVGDLPLVLATIAGGADPKGKNAIIRNQGAKVANWAGIAGPYLTDGVHPNAAGYKQRASLIAGLVNGIKGKPLAKKTRETLKRTAAQRQAKKSRKRTKQIRRHDRGRAGARDSILAGLALDPAVAEKINVLTQEIGDREASFATMESYFNLDEIVTQDELNQLVGDKVGIRNLIGGDPIWSSGLMGLVGGLAVPAVKTKVDALADQIAKWKFEVQTQLRIIAERERRMRELQDRIAKLEDAIGRVDNKKNPTKAEKADRARWKDELKVKRAGRNQIRDVEIPAAERDLMDLTGEKRPAADFSSLTDDSVLGRAELAMTDLTTARDEWQEMLRPGGLPSEWASHDIDAKALIREGPTKIDPDDDSERVSILEQLLRESNQRTAVSEAQYKVLRTAGDLFPPYGGIFHEGGIVPGPPTQERTTILRGREGVFTEEQMAAMSADGGSYEPHVTVNLANGMEWLERFLEVKVERKLRQEGRRGGKLMAGQAGALRG